MKFLDDIIPDTLYLSAFSWMLLIFLYLPLLIWLQGMIWKKLKISRPWRITVMITTAVIAILIPLGDVYLSSLQMEKYCKAEAGTHINKTVTVDGFFLNRYKNVRLDLGHNYLFDYGYRYYEIKHQKKYYVAEKYNGEIKTTENNHPVSKYEYYHERKVINKYLLKRQEVIKDINNNIILAKWVDFSYYPGWMDRQIANLMGGYSPPHCKIPEFKASEFYLSVLIPSG